MGSGRGISAGFITLYLARKGIQPNKYYQINI
jgi:hypothetical protein